MHSHRLRDYVDSGLAPGVAPRNDDGPESKIRAPA